MQITILIVDDVPANLIALEALLNSTNENYRILKANSGSEALEFALKEHLDLIILDIQMPDMDGFEVAELLKINKKTADIPVIFLTAAFKSEEWKEKGFELGAVDYLTKPIDENLFLNRIALYTKLLNTISENRKKDKILNEQSKMASMGEMIGNIAHQWRQPLSIIRTAATSISVQKEYNTLSDEFLNDMIGKIDESTQYLSDTIDDFRDFAKGQSHEKVFNVSRSLLKAVKIIDATFKNNSIKLICDFDDTLELKGNENLFLQVVINIFSNAKDALKKKDEDDRFVFIKTYKNNGKINISIKDSGDGIDENDISYIFDAYFTTKHKAQGTGLGLYMSYNIINSMKGNLLAKNTISSYNEHTYRGAEFVIEL